MMAEPTRNLGTGRAGDKTCWGYDKALSVKKSMTVSYNTIHVVNGSTDQLASTVIASYMARNWRLLPLGVLKIRALLVGVQIGPMT